MSESDAILALVKQIDDRTSRIETFLQKHQDKDDANYAVLDGRIAEIEGNKKTAKAVVITALFSAVLIGGAAGGVAQKILEHFVFE